MLGIHGTLQTPESQGFASSTTLLNLQVNRKMRHVNKSPNISCCESGGVDQVRQSPDNRRDELLENTASPLKCTLIGQMDDFRVL